MKSKLHLTLYTAFLLTIFVLAYVGLIPTELALLPFFDSIGHFILYGIWGYLSAKVFYNPIISIKRFRIQAGIFIVIIIAIVEESFQAFFPYRTFSVFDIAWGIVGILLACVILNWRRDKEWSPTNRQQG